jgi:hypothetical protein
MGHSGKSPGTEIQRSKWIVGFWICSCWLLLGRSIVTCLFLTHVPPTGVRPWQPPCATKWCRKGWPVQSLYHAIWIFNLPNWPNQTFTYCKLMASVNFISVTWSWLIHLLFFTLYILEAFPYQHVEHFVMVWTWNIPHRLMCWMLGP